MAGPEDGEEVGVGAGLRVELEADHLDVVGGTRADQLVVRVVNVALRVADFGLGNANHPLERQLDSPEAPCPELRELEARFVRGIQIRIQGRVVRCSDVLGHW